MIIFDILALFFASMFPYFVLRGVAGKYLSDSPGGAYWAPFICSPLAVLSALYISVAYALPRWASIMSFGVIVIVELAMRAETLRLLRADHATTEDNNRFLLPNGMVIIVPSWGLVIAAFLTAIPTFLVGIAGWPSISPDDVATANEWYVKWPMVLFGVGILAGIFSKEQLSKSASGAQEVADTAHQIHQSVINDYFSADDKPYLSAERMAKAAVDDLRQDGRLQEAENAYLRAIDADKKVSYGGNTRQQKLNLAIAKNRALANLSPIGTT